MVLAALFLGLVGVPDSQLLTPSGSLERFVSDADERDFSVRLTRPDGKIEWLETTPVKVFSLPEKIYRKKISENEEAVVLESFDEKQILGISRRVFDFSRRTFDCEATAEIGFPSPLSEPVSLLLNKLRCADKTPTTETENLRVIGKENHSWVNCDPHQRNCVWNQNPSNEPEAAAQTSAFSFLWTAQKSFEHFSLRPKMRSLIAKSWSSSANQSSYNAELRSLFYGEGKRLDALDGFVVVHEWGHSVIDDLNPRLYGYESRVLHEALADFIASVVFDSPCIAPYDAEEVPNRKCVRDLTEEKSYLRDMRGDNAHLDSLILSGALVEAKSALGSGLSLETSLEALMRLPKDIQLRMYWSKFKQVYSRLLLERTNLIDHRAELDTIGEKHGLQ
jgi:hypothetical protein